MGKWGNRTCDHEQTSPVTVGPNTMRTLHGATLVDWTGYPVMLHTYRVRVLAYYAREVELMRCVHASRPSDLTDARPEWDTSAVHWTASEEAAGNDFGTDVGQTLTVIYDAEGRNANEAARFAHAIFECERKRAAFPVPDMLAVFPE